MATASNTCSAAIGRCRDGSFVHRGWVYPEFGGLTYERPVASLASVFNCVARALTILALCCAIGLHWMTLQSVAWTTMLIEYTKSAPLCQAILQTFDGAHPCSLCHIVNKGKASEKKPDVQSPTPKIDIICLARSTWLLPPFAPFEYAARVFPSSDIGYSPPVPPPRAQVS